MPGWGDFTDPLFLVTLQQMLQQQQQPVYTNVPPIPNFPGPAPINQPVPQNGGTFNDFGPTNQVIDTGNDYSPDPYQSRNYLMNQGLTPEQAIRAEAIDKNQKQQDKQAEADRTQNLLQQGYTPEDATVLARGMMQNAYISPDAHQGIYERQQANIEQKRQQELQDQLALYNQKAKGEFIMNQMDKMGIQLTNPQTGERYTSYPWTKLDAKGNVIVDQAKYNDAMTQIGQRFDYVMTGKPLPVEQVTQKAPPAQVKAKAQGNLSKIDQSKPDSSIGEATRTAGGTLAGTINDLIGLGIPPAAIMSRLTELLRTKKLSDITLEDLRGITPIQYAQNLGQGK